MGKRDAASLNLAVIQYFSFQSALLELCLFFVSI